LCPVFYFYRMRKTLLLIALSFGCYVNKLGAQQFTQGYQDSDKEFQNKKLKIEIRQEKGMMLYKLIKNPKSEPRLKYDCYFKLSQYAFINDTEYNLGDADILLDYPFNNSDHDSINILYKDIMEKILAYKGSNNDPLNFKCFRDSVDIDSTKPFDINFGGELYKSKNNTSDDTILICYQIDGVFAFLNRSVIEGNVPLQRTHHMFYDNSDAISKTTVIPLFIGSCTSTNKKQINKLKLLRYYVDKYCFFDWD